MIRFVIVISCLSLAFAVYLARQVLSKDTGTAKMREISDAIKGRRSHLCRGKTALITVRGFSRAYLYPLCLCAQAESGRSGATDRTGIWTTLAFVLGAACSVIAGYVGMGFDRANIRTAGGSFQSERSLADRHARRRGVRLCLSSP
jgi:K(+)-stimulated pyrophosphate-energized sodium pump